MQFLDEIPYMRLFSANKKIYAPIDPSNRRKGAAIMLLTENPVDSTKLMELPYLYNPGLFTGLYIDRNVNAYINSGAIIDDEVNDPDSAVNEAVIHTVKQKDLEIKLDLHTSSANDIAVLKRILDEKKILKWYKELNCRERYIPFEITVHAYPTVKDLAHGANKVALKNKEIATNSYSTFDEIFIVAPSGYNKSLEKSEGKYENYVMNEIITQACMNTSRRCSRFIANSIGTALSGQLNDKFSEKIENDWAGVKDDKIAVAYTISKMYKEEGMRPIRDMVKTGDLYGLTRYASRNFVRRISGVYEATLTSAERKAMADKDYGLPGQKKYPMPDESHVRSAIRFFNHVDPSDEAELARNINKKIKQYNLDVNVGKDNRFSKYYKKSSGKSKNESYLVEDTDRMRVASFRDITKTYGKANNHNKAGNERYISIVSGNAFESLAVTNPELFNTQKLKQIESSENIVEAFNNYMNGAFSEASNSLNKVIEKIKNSKGDNGKSTNIQSETNILVMRMIDDAEELAKLEGLSKDKIKELVLGVYVPEALTEAGCRKLINIRINNNRILTNSLKMMIESNYQSLNLSEEEAKSLIKGLENDVTNAESIGKIRGILKNPDLLKQYEPKDGVYDFRKLGGACIFYSGDDDIRTNDVPSKHLQNIFKYDAIVTAHGTFDRNASSRLKSFKNAREELSSDIATLRTRLREVLKVKEKTMGNIDKIISSYGATPIVVPNPNDDDFKQFLASKGIKDGQSYNFMIPLEYVQTKSKEYAEKNTRKFIEDIFNRVQVCYEAITSIDMKTSDENIYPVLDTLDENVGHIYDNYSKLMDVLEKEAPEVYKWLTGIREFTSYTRKLLRDKSRIKSSGKGFESRAWIMQNTPTLNLDSQDENLVNNQKDTIVVEYIRQLKKEGFKNILFTACNPGSIKLPDDISKDPNFKVTYGKSSVAKEQVDEYDNYLDTLNESLNYIIEQDNLDVYGKSVNTLIKEYNDIQKSNNVLSEGVIDVLKSIVKKAKEVIIAIWKALVKLFKTIWKKIKEFFVGKPTEKVAKQELKKEVEMTVIEASGNGCKIGKYKIDSMQEGIGTASKASESLSKFANNLQSKANSAIQAVENAINARKVQPNNQNDNQTEKQESALLEFDWEPDKEITKSKVYFTDRITPDSLVEIYKALGVELNGKVAVKISTGEPGKGPRYCLNPQLIDKFVNSLDGTIVETNVAYEGPRHTTEAHWETIKKHGYYDIAPCDILDEDGDYSIPVENGLVLKNVLAGKHMKNYDSFIILSHFKGHAMGGYSGALKNVAIGLSSADGKKVVHSGGHVTDRIAGMTDDDGIDSADKPVHDLFLRSMADANKAFGKEMRSKGNPVVYINVANNISVDCDCDPEPHAPTMKDIGIFASLDPVAVDQAAIDAVYAAPDSNDVIRRIEERYGLRTLDYAMELGLGNRDYDLIDIDKQFTKAKVNISVNKEPVLQEVKFENDKGEKVPKTCPKCGAKVGVFFRGEPVFLCSNKDCGKYFGTVPFDESTILETDLAFNKPKDLSDWMRKNIKYKQYTSLMSADDVYSSKEGSCHDQVMFELKMLKMIPSCSNCRAWFVFEHDGNGQGGETHSYVTYKQNGRLYWFENAWTPRAGIHQIEDSNEFKRLHDSGAWGNKNKFPEIEITPFRASQGMSLQQLVNSCLRESTILEGDGGTKLMNLDKFISVPMTPQNIRFYKDQAKGLSHIRTGDNCKGKIFIENKDGERRVVGFYNTETKSNGEVWLQAIEVMPNYQSQGIGKLLLQDSIKEGAKYLAVAKNNTRAKSMYINHGFKSYERTDKMVFMKLESTILEDSIDDEAKKVANERQGVRYFDFIGNLSNLFKDIGALTAKPRMDPEKGEYEKLRPWLMTLVDKADSMKRIQYLRRDAYTGINQLSTLSKNMKDVKAGTQSRYVNVNYINNLFKKGNSPEKVDAHIKWMKEEYIPYINNRAKEIRKTTNESYNLIPLPVRSINESMNDNGYIYTDDYIMNEDFITFFNGMDDQVITEAEKKYDAKLKSYLFQQRMKNNKAVVMRYQEMKAMSPWIKKTYLKLPMYRGYNIFVDLSYYHGLFLKNLKLTNDNAINMYWDFINRILNDTEYKGIYNKITIFIPVYPGAWDVDNPEDLMNYRKSINPISLIVRMIRHNPGNLKAWGNKDILFVSPKGYFKINFTTFAQKDLAKFKQFIGKLATYDDIADDESEDGYGNKSVDTDSPAAITAKITDKIEKNTGIKLDDITGNGDMEKALPEKVQVDHLRIRTGKFNVPTSKIKGDEITDSNTVIIFAPNDDATVEAVKNSALDLKFSFSDKGFYTP